MKYWILFACLTFTNYIFGQNEITKKIRYGIDLGFSSLSNNLSYPFTEMTKKWIPFNTVYGGSTLTINQVFSPEITLFAEINLNNKLNFEMSARHLSLFYSDSFLKDNSTSFGASNINFSSISAGLSYKIFKHFDNRVMLFSKLHLSRIHGYGVGGTATNAAIINGIPSFSIFSYGLSYQSLLPILNETGLKYILSHNSKDIMHFRFSFNFTINSNFQYNAQMTNTPSSTELFSQQTRSSSFRLSWFSVGTGFYF